MIDERSALLYAQMPEHRFLVTKTKRFIGWTLKQVANPYLACSFGKDSAVMLHLVYSLNNQIPVRFLRWKNETEFLDNYDEVIAQWDLKNLIQIELQRNSLSEKVEERKSFGTEEYDSYFIGFRKQESAGRRITLATLGKFAKVAGKYRICPLAEWTDKDIWAYIFSNNLPTLKSYFVNSDRTASRIPREDNGIRSLSLSNLKARDMNAYNQLVGLFPEINNFL